MLLAYCLNNLTIAKNYWITLSNKQVVDVKGLSIVFLAYKIIQNLYYELLTLHYNLSKLEILCDKQ